MLAACLLLIVANFTAANQDRQFVVPKQAEAVFKKFVEAVVSNDIDQVWDWRALPAAGLRSHLRGGGSCGHHVTHHRRGLLNLSPGLVFDVYAVLQPLCARAQLRLAGQQHLVEAG